MNKLVYSKADQRIFLVSDNTVIKSYECRDDFEEGLSPEGLPRESLPVGQYITNAEEPPTDHGPAYGTFYITTGDERSRDIHGGGSSLPDPYASYQGWLCTYGCLRMQNADGEELSNILIALGNDIPLEVISESYSEA